MKLLMCRKCGDVRKLDLELTRCKCGACRGRYLEDGLKAVVNEESVVLGINNNDLVRALREGRGDVGAWVMPRNARNTEWVSDSASIIDD